MTVLTGDLELSAARGLTGPPGEVSAAQLAAAIAALKGGVDPAGDTLAELYALILLRAALASPAFTGNPTAPTQSVLNNSTKLATTEYTDRAVTNSAATLQPLDALLTALAALSPTLSGVLLYTSGAASALTLDTDGTLAANSDTRLATQKAVKAYADALIAANDAMVFKGVIDCSANPNYPAADRGHSYKVSVAGKIGGGSGTNVEVGDLLICITDSTASGTQAGVGANWVIVQTNLDGAVIGPASSTSGNAATFNGTSGKLIQDSGKALPSGTIVGTSDSQTLTSKSLTSPTLTGTPTTPTASPGTNNTQVASTAYADAIAALKANIASPTFTGVPAAPTASPATNNTQLATTAYADVRGGTRASFSAHKNNVDQTGIASATPTKITFINELFDKGSFYDAPNSKWVPPAGTVRLSATVVCSAGAAAGSPCVASIYKNGSVMRSFSINAADTNQLLGLTVSLEDDANGTDYYEVYVNITSAGTSTLSGHFADSYFTGSLL